MKHTYSNNSRRKNVSAFRFRLGILIWSKITQNTFDDMISIVFPD